jgi:ATP-dependent RNA helicase
MQTNKFELTNDKTVSKKDTWDDEPINTSINSKVMNTTQESFTKSPIDNTWNESIPTIADIELDAIETAIAKTEELKSNGIVTANSFDQMKLKNGILRGLFAAGFEQPAPCQKIIPSLISTETEENIRDAIISAQAGSGKTLLFSIIGLNAVDISLKKPQIIVLSPTRELALQTFNVICSIASFSEVSIALHRGVGTKTKRDNVSPLLTKAVVKSESYMTFGSAKEGMEQIIIATPGRLLDIITNERGVRITQMKSIPKIDMRFIHMFVMDEADELLSPHNEFQDTIANVFSNIPTIEYCQKIIVSATITPSVIEICNQILKNPLQILIKKEEVPLSAIKQFYVALQQEQDKAECLLDIYKNVLIGTSIIFTNKIEKAEYIHEIMKEKGFAVGYIHAKLSQGDRDSIMNDFRMGNIRVLITTDLLARGIDVQSVSVVFNYDLPNSMENYIHRVGRCGRFGKTGVAVNFVIETYNSKPKEIVTIEKHYNIDIRPLPNLEVLSRV